MKRLMLVCLLVLSGSWVAGAEVNLSVEQMALLGDDPVDFVAGDLGALEVTTLNVTAKGFEYAAVDVLRDILWRHFDAVGDEEVALVQRQRDGLGGWVLRFQQRYNDLEVDGAQLVMRLSGDGQILSVRGEFSPGRDLPFAPTRRVDSTLAAALKASRVDHMPWIEGPRLTYVRSQQGSTHLAWKVVLRGDDPELGHLAVFVDAMTGQPVVVRPALLTPSLFDSTAVSSELWDIATLEVAMAPERLAAILDDARAHCRTPLAGDKAMRHCTVAAAELLYGEAEGVAMGEVWDRLGVRSEVAADKDNHCINSNMWVGTASDQITHLVTPSCSTSGEFEAQLACEQGVADLDLYLEQQACGGWFGCSFVPVAASTSGSCDESIEGFRGHSDVYRWHVVHYSGPAEPFMLCTNQC